MLKLNVGLSRKVGEPDYGSRGNSVHLELEVESALAGDPEALQEHIRSLFRLARAAIDNGAERERAKQSWRRPRQRQWPGPQ